MPGSVNAAVSNGVLPDALCRAFGHVREIPVLENRYREGESQASLLVTAGASRKYWTLTRRLTATEMTTLVAFLEANPHTAFYFYDCVNHKDAVYDPGGGAVIGRYLVRMEGGWRKIGGMGRSDVSLSLVEVA